MHSKNSTAARLAALWVALLLALTIWPGLALAHAKLTSSTPADGATVPSGVTEITLNFSEEVSIEQTSADISGPDGKVAGVTAAVDRAERTKMAVTSPALADGKYTVNWAAVTEDDNGHSNGSFSFTVGNSSTGSTSSGGTSTPSSGGGNTLPVTGTTSDGWGALAVALIALVAGVAMRRRATA